MLVYITIISFNNSIYAFCCIAAFFRHLQDWHIQHAFLYDDVLTEKKNNKWDKNCSSVCGRGLIFKKTKQIKTKSHVSCILSNLLHPCEGKPWCLYYIPGSRFSLRCSSPASDSCCTAAAKTSGCHESLIRVWKRLMMSTSPEGCFILWPL